MDNADTLRVRPVSMTASVGTFSGVELRGVNSGDFWLRDEAIAQFGVWHRLLGGAVLDTSNTNGPPTLGVSNLGPSGDDGVEVFANGIAFFDPERANNEFKQRIVQFFDPTLNSGDVRWTATGRVQAPSNSFENLADLSAFRQEQGTMLTASFAPSLGVTQVEVDAFKGGQLVGIMTLPVGQLGLLTGTGRVSRVGFHVTDTVCWRLRFAGDATFTPMTGLPLTGTFLRFGAVHPQGTVLGLRSLITRAANVGFFRLNNVITAAPLVPRLSLVRQGNTPRLMIPSDAQAICTIEASQSITGPWAPLGTIGGTDGEMEFADPSTSGVTIRFYRVRGE